MACLVLALLARFHSSYSQNFRNVIFHSRFRPKHFPIEKRLYTRKRPASTPTISP
jgi:hypothetical protein